MKSFPKEHFFKAKNSIMPRSIIPQERKRKMKKKWILIPNVVRGKVTGRCPIRKRSIEILRRRCEESWIFTRLWPAFKFPLMPEKEIICSSSSLFSCYLHRYQCIINSVVFNIHGHIGKDRRVPTVSFMWLRCQMSTCRRNENWTEKDRIRTFLLNLHHTLKSIISFVRRIFGRGAEEDVNQAGEPFVDFNADRRGSSATQEPSPMAVTDGTSHETMSTSEATRLSTNINWRRRRHPSRRRIRPNTFYL